MLDERRHNQSGFALPLAIFFMAILTLLLTAAFAKIQGDRRVADSSGDAVTALAVAQSGLHTYVGTRTGRPANGDSVRVNVVGGYADVIAHVMQRPADTMAAELFVVRSTGHVINPTQGSDPQASRTVARFVQWQASGGLTTFPAAFTAANGLRNYTNGIVTITGVDSASCGATTIGGLWVYKNNPNYGGANGITMSGSPAHNDDDNNQSTVADRIGVTWSTIEADGFTPNYTSLSNTSTLNTWSTYVVSGTPTLTASGSGILIAKDSLIIGNVGAPSITWSGIILVGKSVRFNALITRIEGLLVTGLDRQLSGGASNTNNGSVGGTGKTQIIEYNSCNIRRALQYVSGFAPVLNGWVDNWGTY
ncbi:MAG: hypothetical protein HY700_07435 [Gemmatimonadetes bacterium]|nr:hypothetical protein [Gemmatimonadota bacterium]